MSRGKQKLHHIVNLPFFDNDHVALESWPEHYSAWLLFNGLWNIQKDFAILLCVHLIMGCHLHRCGQRVVFDAPRHIGSTREGKFRRVFFVKNFDESFASSRCLVTGISRARVLMFICAVTGFQHADLCCPSNGTVCCWVSTCCEETNAQATAVCFSRLPRSSACACSELAAHYSIEIDLGRLRGCQRGNSVTLLNIAKGSLYLHRVVYLRLHMCSSALFT